MQIKAVINGPNGDLIFILPKCATDRLVAQVFQRVQPRRPVITLSRDAVFFPHSPPKIKD
ncbi:hypothetical protein [Bradyrhizobium erythrophlei]|uniref:Uncharacterized protein n=1 Tax=Bradyrhizobium erythrophlei TaxID=1437360 RepID=A0A1M5RA50_9BRAD|nr:hypothetical protein [Bradyrhizobium erythrophlei]SHH23237.1 hypothetical protein SAMN05444169_6445 [Bradyrhizobium erythrophlei]